MVDVLSFGWPWSCWMKQKWTPLLNPSKIDFKTLTKRWYGWMVVNTSAIPSKQRKRPAFIDRMAFGMVLMKFSIFSHLSLVYWCCCWGIFDIPLPNKFVYRLIIIASKAINANKMMAAPWNMPLNPYAKKPPVSCVDVVGLTVLLSFDSGIRFQFDISAEMQKLLSQIVRSMWSRGGMTRHNKRLTKHCWFNIQHRCSIDRNQWTRVE